MDIYYIVVSFIFGITLGSFYNVVGYRLPRDESLIYPSSHCTNCNHKLGLLDLIPVFSFLFLKGSCRYCSNKISWFYPFFEFMTGVLFVCAYLVFGISLEFLLALIFISTLLIVIISDYQTMIIPDQLLIFSSFAIIAVLLMQNGLETTCYSILHGVGAFLFMFSLKKFGDFLFKKESMGGGDIKLMFIFGLIMGLPMSIVAVFVSSFIGLPISLIVLYKKKDHEIPFGPFLSIAAILLFLLQIDLDFIVNLLG